MIVYHFTRGKGRQREFVMECSNCGADPIDVPHPRYMTVQLCPNGCQTLEEAVEEKDILIAQLRKMVV